MQVFLSWSDVRSKAIAEALRGWLPKVLQSVKPWMSDEDISAGSQWLSEISGSLNTCGVGIICVTPENQHNPWLQFEAGALSKTLDQTCVCPLVYDMTLGQLSGPLTQFQGNELNQGGMLKVLLTLNKKLSSPLEINEIEEILDVWWGKLQEKLDIIPAPAETPEVRTVGDQLDELLELSREQLRRENLRLERALRGDDKFERMIASLERSGVDLQRSTSKLKKGVFSLPELFEKMGQGEVDSNGTLVLEGLNKAFGDELLKGVKDLPDFADLDEMIGELKDIKKKKKNMLNKCYLLMKTKIVYSARGLSAVLSN